MAAFTLLAWVKWLSPQRRRALGLPADTQDPKTGPGRKKTLTPEALHVLDQHVETRQQEIDNGTVRFENRYGDSCSDADAIRSFARDEYRRRLIEEEGTDPAQADQIVEAYARTPEFARHVTSYKVALSQLRRLTRA